MGVGKSETEKGICVTFAQQGRTPHEDKTDGWLGEHRHLRRFKAGYTDVAPCAHIVEPSA